MRGHHVKNKRDANEPEIVEAFRKHGFTVERLDRPMDLLVGRYGRNWLIEVKVEGAKLNANQKAFAERWKGHFAVVRSVQDVAEFARDVAR